MSLKIGDFKVVVDLNKSLGTNEIKLHGSFFESGGMLKESPHLVKIKTNGYKRMFLSVISGSNTQSQVNMHLDIMGRLNVNENEKVEITKCGIIDHVIRILTSFDITKMYYIVAASLGILLVIFVIKFPPSYITWTVTFFFIIFIFIKILSILLRKFYLKTT